MPNIYLRLPTNRCQFFRNRDPKKPIAKHEPLVFNAYTPEYFVLRGSLYNAATQQSVNTQCFSHQQWRNMQHGRHPLGGNVIMKREVEDYLTFAEVQTLNGYKDYNKSVNDDYLCIKLPSEMLVVDTVRPVTPTWNLGVHGLRQLLILLNNDFKRSVVEWALSSFDYCTSNGRIVARSQTDMLERFLMRYGIEQSIQEKDNLRRIITRWLHDEHKNFSSYSCLDMQYEDGNENEYPIDSIEWE